MAFDGDGFAVVDHRLQLLLAQRNQASGDVLLGAAAQELRWGLVQDLQVHVAEDVVQDLFRPHAVLHHLRDRFDGGKFCFQLFDQIVACARHQLYDKAAGLRDRVVLVHQHTQCNRARCLFRFGEVVGQVFGDLTGAQRGLADVRLLQSEVLDDGQSAIADGGADIQFARVVGRDQDQGIVDVALYIAVRIGGYSDSADRAVALHDEGEDIVALHHHTHHRAAAQQAAEGRGCDRAGIVARPGVFHHFGGADRECSYFFSSCSSS